MDDLLVIKTNKYALKDFSPDSSIRLWWEAKTRRPNQKGMLFVRSQVVVVLQLAVSLLAC